MFSIEVIVVVDGPDEHTVQELAKIHDARLRVIELAINVGIAFVPEPLAICHSELERQRLSNGSDWKYSLDWIRSVRKLVTPRAYSSFITTVVSSQAAAVGDWSAFIPLLWESLRIGSPRPLDLLLYFSMWLVPPHLRHSWRLRKAA